MCLKDRFIEIINNNNYKFSDDIIASDKWTTNPEESILIYLIRIGIIRDNYDEILDGIKYNFTETLMNVMHNSNKCRSDTSELPLLSFIIPTYNSEKYIGQCIDSILKFEKHNIEIIIVDNMSNDSTYSIIKDYKNSNIIYLKNNKIGAGGSRNIGLQYAHGKYIHFVDSDDFILDNYVRIFNLLNDNFDAIMFSYKILDNSSKQLKSSYLTKIINVNDDYNILDVMKYDVVPWNKIFKRDYIISNNIYFDNFLVANDRNFYFRFLKSYPKIKFIKDEIIVYRVNNTSQLTGKKREENFDCHFLSFIETAKIFNNNIKEFCVALQLFLEDLKYFYNKSVNKFRIRKMIYDFYYKNKHLFSFYKELRRKNIYRFLLEMIRNDKTLPIVFSVNDLYAPYLSVALVSLITNSDILTNYSIYILYTKLSEENIIIIKNMFSNLQNFSIYFIDLTYVYDYKKLYSKGYFSLDMYYRINIPNLFSYFYKILYIDCDVIIKSNLKELFNINLSDCYIGAAIDSSPTGHLEYITKKLGLKQYINSGVLLFNTSEYNRDNIGDKILEFVKNNRDLPCPDQDAINAVCKKIKLLDNKFNFSWQPEVNSEKYSTKDIENNMAKEMKYIDIIHFTSSLKPWNVDISFNRYSEEWWKYAKLSPYYNKIINDFNK